MSVEFSNKRKQLAQHIFQEVQKGQFQSTEALYKALNQQLENMSDQAVDIMIRQQKL